MAFLRRPAVIIGIILTVLAGLVVGSLIGYLSQQAAKPAASVTPSPTTTFTITPILPTPATIVAPTIAATNTEPVPATATPEPVTQPAGTPTTHEVQAGETLGEIALRYGVSVEALLAENGLDSAEFLQIGQDLKIPTAGAEGEATTTTTSLPQGVRTHIVEAGDTLGGIALQYDVSVEALREANDLDSDIIQLGQELTIPGDDVATTTPESAAGPAADATDDETWNPSILTGDLATAYSQTEARGRYTLHYPPDSLPERELDAVLASVDTAMTQIEGPLGIQLDGTFDVYVAASLFAADDVALRGRSFSSQRRLFFLWDGTGDDADRQYIITHEATHTFTWNAIGQPASVMLHEGVAVYTGMSNYENAGYINLDDFCAVFYRAERLPLPTGAMDFQGHIYDLTTYYSAGSFVRYLIDTYGAEKFARLYPSGDYVAVYDQDLPTLQEAWLAQLAARELPANLNAGALIQYVDEVGQNYRQLFANFSGTPAEMRAYRALDKARTSTLAGHFTDARTYLDDFAAARRE
ncbi:MAG: LysM peptidoglycan-binding domain-containing protein [Anaerolineae bacterium]